MLVRCFQFTFFQFVFFQLIIHQQKIGQQKQSEALRRSAPKNRHSVKTLKFAPYFVLISLMLIYTPQMLSTIVGTKKRVISPLPLLSPFAGAPRGVFLACSPLFSSFVRVVFFSSVLVYVLLFVLYLFLVFISSILSCSILVQVYI